MTSQRRPVASEDLGPYLTRDAVARMQHFMQSAGTADEARRRQRILGCAREGEGNT